MRRLPYYVVDAFTAEVFGGNPAGVCPLQEWLPDPVLQAIAAENNLAETAFFVPAGPRYQLRWFTPALEVPLCGHATLAAGSVVLDRLRPDLDEVCFESSSGPLTVRRDGTWFELDLPRFDHTVVSEPPPMLAAALGVTPARILRVDDDPNYYAILEDEAAVRRLEPRLDLLAALHPYGVAVSARGDAADFVSRYFAPSYGIPEDAVTGSIHAVLAPYWAEVLGREALAATQASRRGGRLRCSVGDRRVRVAGQTASYLEGTIAVPAAGAREPFGAERGDYAISTDPARLDLRAMHAYLSRSYWSAGIPLEVVRRAVAGSLCFGLYHGRAQVGFARMVTDRATFAYLADVYVLEEHRGRGLGKWLVETVLAHPDLQGIRRLMLVTRDAHSLYARHGFAPPAEPANVMEIRRANPYAAPDQAPGPSLDPSPT